MSIEKIVSIVIQEYGKEIGDTLISFWEFFQIRIKKVICLLKTNPGNKCNYYHKLEDKLQLRVYQQDSKIRYLIIIYRLATMVAYEDLDLGHIQAIIFHLREVDINHLISSMLTDDVENNLIFLSKNFRYREIDPVQSGRKITQKKVNKKKCKRSEKEESNINSIEVSELDLYWSGFIWDEEKTLRRKTFGLDIDNKLSPYYKYNFEVSSLSNSLGITEKKILECLNLFINETPEIYSKLLGTDESPDLELYLENERYYLAIIPFRIPIFLLDKNYKSSKILVIRFHLRVDMIDSVVHLSLFSFNLRFPGINEHKDLFNNNKRCLYPSDGLINFMNLYPYGTGNYAVDIWYLTCKNIDYNYLQNIDDFKLRKYMLLSIVVFYELREKYEEIKRKIYGNVDKLDLSTLPNNLSVSKGSTIKVPDKDGTSYKLEDWKESDLDKTKLYKKKVIEILKREIDKLI